jgi:hypothetical protein
MVHGGFDALWAQMKSNVESWIVSTTEIKNELKLSMTVIVTDEMVWSNHKNCCTRGSKHPVHTGTNRRQLRLATAAVIAIAAAAIVEVGLRHVAVFVKVVWVWTHKNKKSTLYQNMWYSIFDFPLNARQRPAAQWASTCLTAFL